MSANILLFIRNQIRSKIIDGKEPIALILSGTAYNKFVSVQEQLGCKPELYFENLPIFVVPDEHKYCPGSDFWIKIAVKVV
jgi:hypothetical protein